MKLLRKYIGGFLISVLLLNVSGCSKAETLKSDVKSNKINSHYPITIITYDYKKEPVEITFDKEPENVVAVYQNSIETLLALGLSDKIVLGAGLDHDIKEEYKEEFKDINYSNKFTPDKEDILNEEVDFILSWHSIFDERRLGDVGYWHDKNINTYMSINSGVYPKRTVENEIMDIQNIGKIFNVEEKSNNIVKEINVEIDKVLEKTKNKKTETTLIIEYAGDNIYTYGEDTLGGDMISRLGAKLLNPQGGNITEEDLIDLNPDSIFVVYMDRMDTNIPSQEVNKILNNPKLIELKAVKSNRVNSIALGEMYCSGVRTVDGIKTFAKGLYENEYK